MVTRGRWVDAIKAAIDECAGKGRAAGARAVTREAMSGVQVRHLQRSPLYCFHGLP